MNIVRFENIADKLIIVQGEKVLLDSDVGEIYGVETKRINEAVKNNPDKFSVDHILELSDESWEFLRSKISTLNGIGRGKIVLTVAKVRLKSPIGDL